MNATALSSVRISDVLAERAASQGERVALHFISDAPTRTFTYAELDLHARAIAQALAVHAAPGERALLLLPSGEDYVAAFFGCLYAGVIAVPLFPPQTQRSHHVERLRAIVADCAPRLLLGTSAALPALAPLLADAPGARCVAVDALPPASAAFDRRESVPDATAFLQYTSGSTAAPKGVQVSHANLMANEKAIAQALAIDARDVFVSWLPLYHDMGLIGSLLPAIYNGVPLVLMAPEFFLERPLRWLEAISRFGGTISGGPDFSYRLCLERISPAQRRELDLRSWRVAFSGAEPIRFDTLCDFTRDFANAGLDAAALYPSYGLAEATLFVTGTSLTQRFSALPAATEPLTRGEVVRDESGRPLVDCGVPAPEHAVVIVDPQRLNTLPENRVGEIWVSGPSIALGYWNNEQATRDAFVERDGVRYLRTGDLGFQQGGHLYVSGRLKDLIIVRGQNLYPQDIEQTIERAVVAVRKGRVAAFAFDTAAGEAIGVACEVGRRARNRIAPQALAASISAAVAAAHREAVALVVLLEPGALPKTSSGKLQRSACRSGWRDGTLRAYAVYRHGRPLRPGTGSETRPDAEQATGSNAEFEARLAPLWRELLGVDDIESSDHFFVLGGNSLSAAQLCARLREQWHIVVPPRLLFEAPTLREFSAALAAQADRADRADKAAEAAMTPAPRAELMPQSFAQSRLWFLAQLQPDSAAYNLALTLDLQGELDEAALARALEALVARHEVLRTTFHAEDGAALMRIHDTLAPQIERHDLSALPVVDGAVRAGELARARAAQSFDLSKGPLLRLTLFALGDGRYQLHFVTHHIVADGWSMPIFLRELAQLYAAQRERTDAGLPALPLQYADFAAWQRRWLEAGEGERQLAWWRAQLGDEQPLLALPSDRPRPAAQSHRGASLHFGLAPSLTARLRRLAQAQQVTPFMVLLAAFKVFLYRHSGHNDIRVGVPVANRPRVATEALMGFFANTVVLRSRVDGRASFAELLRQVRDTTLGAQAHQDLPFEQLVEALQPQRSLGHNPLFQVKFNYGFAVPDWPASTGLQGRGRIDDTVGAHFDLALDITERADALDAVFSYATDLFEAATIARWRDFFLVLLERLIDSPEQQLAHGATAADAAVLRGARCDFPARSVLALQARRVLEDPFAPALQSGARICTRNELERASNAVAAQLRGRGIGREHIVALCAPRGIEWVIGLLGVLKAGAAYVPLDPQAPPERLRRIADSCGAALVLSAGAALTAAHELDREVLALENIEHNQAPATTDVENIDAAQLAYVIFTSGSSGEPKGVAISHGALANYAQGLLARLQIAPGAAMALVSSVAADLGHTVLFGALCGGGVLHLPDADVVADPDRFADYLAQWRVDVLKIVPGHLRGLLQARRPQQVLPAHTLVLGGESCDGALLDNVRALCPQLRIVNHYGPTETTVGVFTADITTLGGAAIPIGAPLPNTSALILDADLNPVPPGVAGELYIGGAGLARGYLGRAALTAECFVPDPCGRGARLYRSGDRARRLPDGAVEFLGRLDDQVKIRGYRVEPGEAARVLRALAGVSDAAVIAERDDNGQMRLCGYCVAPGADAVQLQQQLRRQLPDYLVPAQIVLLERLPLTANGKLDTRALPAARPRASNAELPATALEQQLLALWRELLGIDGIGVTDNFFELGGDSILSLKLIARARRQGISVAPRQIFEAQTVRELAAQLQGAAPVADAEPTNSALPIVPIARSGELALSHAQSRLWFLWQLEPDNSVYNVAGSMRLRGALDETALARTFDTLVQRHETLRTTFSQIDGRLVQRIHTARPLVIACIELDEPDVAAREAEAQRRARIEAQTPFDLDAGPLLRVQLLRLAPDDHLLLVTLHHIIADGWSMNVLIDEFAACYSAFQQGATPALKPLPIQYADYAHWQREWLAGGAAAQQLAWWRRRLGASQPTLELPTDFARPTLPSYRGANLAFAVPADLTEQLRREAQRRRITLSALLLSVFAALLHRCAGQLDIRVGVPVANRRWLETEGLIGFFVNMLVLRVEFDGDPDFDTLLRQVATELAQAQQHQDLPFEALVESINPERSLARNPLFQVTYNHRRREYDPLRDIAGLRAEEPQPAQLVTQFDLTLNTEEIGDELRHSFTYSTDLFTRESIARLADQFVALLRSALARPQQPVNHLALTQTAAAKPALGAATLPGCLHHLVERQVEATPDAVAVIAPSAAGQTSQTLTYAELDRRAQRLAARLRRQGVGPDTLVGVCLERGPQLPVALLAVLKAGGAYLPIDPQYPPGRIRLMLDDARPRVLLTDISWRERDEAIAPPADCALLDVHEPQEENEAGEAADGWTAPGAHNLAYCIYTSGSTGRPKGVMIGHGAIVNHMLWMRDQFGFGADTVVLQKTPFSFDASVWEFWLPLLVGGRCVLAPPGATRDPQGLWSLCAAQGVTVLQVVPSLLRVLLEQDNRRAALAALRYLFCGGELLPAALARYAAAQLEEQGGGELWNLYGPTETTIDASAWRCEPTAAGAAAPIGSAIANTALHVLDAALEPVPVGVLGELYVGGAGLARGYLRRPAQTAHSFVPDPFGARGARLYCTGDLARRRADGGIDCVGRSDQQVKVRGFRIELEEIAAALRGCDAVLNACAVARDDLAGVDAATSDTSATADMKTSADRMLVGYVVADATQLKARHRAQQAARGALIEQWESVFDATYAAAAEGPSFTGWNSSYTDAPIAIEQMQDWLDQTLARIDALAPRRVLEIGCGVGLLLQHLAPRCEAYCGTDLSARALASLRAFLRERPALARVELAQREATDFSGFAPGRFDTVVLNSVAQYFPDADYLREVCAGALRVIPHHGALFVGDLRHLGLLRAFHTSVQLERAAAQLPVAQLRQRIDRAIAQDKELVLDPDFFHQLAAQLGGGVDIALKRGRYDNELTRYRYDVVLRPNRNEVALRDSHWRELDGGAAACAARLGAEKPPAWRVRGVPNRRVARDVAACALLSRRSDLRTVEELRAALAAMQPEGEDPETFWALGAACGYQVRLGWTRDSEAGRFDVEFIDPARASTAIAPASAPAAGRRLATDPLLAQLAQPFAASLREQLRARLPEYMVPAHIVVLEQLPLTPNGKLDRAALPAPELAAARRAYVEPRTAVERALADIWRQLLHIESVGASDNFFELGGHSLLATQLVSRIRAQLGVALPLRSVFEQTTLAALAAAIGRQGGGAGSLDRFEALFDELEAQ